MAGPGKRTTSINNFPWKLSTGEPQPKPTWVDNFPGKLKTSVMKKSRMANKKKSRFVWVIDSPGKQKKSLDLFWPSIILQPLRSFSPLPINKGSFLGAGPDKPALTPSHHFPLPASPTH